jgi:hypothetical protein
MPHALGRKLRTDGRALAWQWLFPATRAYCDAETGRFGGTTFTRRCSSEP